MNKKKVLTITICLSFAHLQLLPIFIELSQASDGPNAYFLPLATPMALAGAWFALFIFSALAWAGVHLLNSTNQLVVRRATGFILLISIINPLTLNGRPFFDYRLLLELHTLIATYGWVLIVAAILAAASAVYLSWRWPNPLIGVFRIALIALFPFALLNVGQATWVVIAATSETDLIETQPEAHSSSGQRVVWIVFDELDQRAVFENRPKGWLFPNLDSLAGDAFVATHVEQAARNTLEAIPAMTTGRNVEKSIPINANQLLLRLDGGDEGVDWRGTDNLFTEIDAMGKATGIVGWYHPYCRLFAGLFTSCRPLSLDTVEVTPSGGIGSSTLSRLKALDPFYRRRNAVTAYQQGLEGALEMTSDAELDFVFIHIPLPHAPTIFDAERERFTPYYLSRDGYFNNVAAADRFLGEMRGAMERSGQWEKTAVLITSDHSWRGSAVDYDGENDTRVPFILKLAGPSQPIRYDTPFSATRVKGVLLGLLRGNITSAETVIAGLEK